MSLRAFDVRLPEAYRSTDFKVFEGLGKIALGICKEDINNLSYLNSIEKCPDNLLPYLCKKIGMPYFSCAIPYLNRKMLSCWRWMIKNKGSYSALTLMAAFAVMSFTKTKEELKDDLFYIYSVDVYLRTSKTINKQKYIHIRNFIEVFYELPETITQETMEERLMMFLDYVRPASWRIKFQPALIQREGGEGKGLVIDSRQQNITQSAESYTERHSYVMDVPDEERAESGVDFSEVFKKNI